MAPAPFQGAPTDAYYAAGALGQFTIVLPRHDMVVVRMGMSPNGNAINQSIGTLIQDLMAATGQSLEQAA